MKSSLLKLNNMNKRQPNQSREYKGISLNLMNINWTEHLEHAWQCNWLISDWKTEISYGATPNEAFENMKVKINTYK